MRLRCGGEGGEARGWGAEGNRGVGSGGEEEAVWRKGTVGRVGGVWRMRGE